MANTIQIIIKQTSAGNAISTVSKQLGGLDSAASNSSGAMSKLTTVLGGLGKVALGVGAGGLLALGAGLAKTISVGLGFNNAMEQAAAKINAFTKDAGLTADILETVQERAAKTPFAFEEMANSAAALMPTMRASGESLEFLLEKAEILAASNPMEGLEGASFALKEAVSGDFTSIVERFNLSRQTLKDLKAQGVPALEAVGIAMAELGLDTDLVTALANTAEGRWSTFKDTLTTLAGTVTQPIFDTFSQSLGGLNDLLVENAPQIQAFADALAGGIAEGITALAAKVTELYAAFQAGGTGGLLTALGLGDVVTAWGVVQPILADLQTWLGTNIPIAIQAVTDIWNNNLMPGFTQIYNVINAELLPALQGLFDSFSSGTGGTQGFADLWTGTLQPALVAVGDFLINTLFPAWVNLEIFLVGALSTAINLLASYWSNILFPAISIVADFITGTVVPALSALWDWLGPKLGAGIQALSDLWTGTLQPALIVVGDYLNENIVPLLTSLGELINAVLTKALTALAGLWQNVLWPALQKVGKILSDTLMPVFASIGQTVKKDVSPVLKDLGETVMPLLQEGLDFVTKSIKEVIGYFDSLKATVNSFTLPDILTPGSPPPMANALTDIATSAGAATTALAGMQRSLITSSSSALSFIDDLDMGGLARGFGTGGGQWKNFRNILKNEIMGGMGALADGTADVMDSVYKVAARFNFPPGMAAEFAKANGLVEHLTGNFEKFRQQMNIQNLGNMTQMAASFSGLGSTFADMLAPKLSETSKEIIYLQKFLATTDELSSDGLWNRVMGQEELVELLEKQARQEELITQQKEAQQKLDFLKSQLDLLKLGQSLGGDIFQGITFGLNASVEDMLAAVNAVTMAMVDQIDHDLGIASPSKLLFDKFKNQIGGAMVGGLLAARPMMEGAIQPILNPIMQGANAAGRVVNNYFNQTVNTRADSSSVIGDFRTMQLMAG